MRIELDDPRAQDVQALLKLHLAASHEQSPPEHVHALDVQGLLDPRVSFFSARTDEALLGVGALKRLDETHAELKSMHTTQAARGQGVGQALLAHLLEVAQSEGYRRVSLETGTMEYFAAARRLYERAGFTVCAPFGAYTDNPYSLCMTLTVGSSTTATPPSPNPAR